MFCHLNCPIQKIPSPFTKQFIKPIFFVLMRCCVMIHATSDELDEFSSLYDPAQCHGLDCGAEIERAFDRFIDDFVSRSGSVDLINTENDLVGAEAIVEHASLTSVACRRPSKNTVKPKLAPRSAPSRLSEVKSVRGKQLRAAPSASWLSRPLVVRRPLSNETYLRRLHLSPEQAISLLPCLASSVLPVATSTEVRAKTKYYDVRLEISLVNSSGQQWRAVCECVLSSKKKQLHCRLGEGWAQFCRDNGAAVHDVARMERSGAGSGQVQVRFE